MWPLIASVYSYRRYEATFLHNLSEDCQRAIKHLLCFYQITLLFELLSIYCFCQ